MNVVLRATRFFWRLLPRDFRRGLLVRCTAMVTPRLARDCPAALPVTVAGLLGATTGLGEGARLQLEALVACGYPVRHHDLSDALDCHDLPQAAAPGGSLAAGGGTLLLHLNPNVLNYGLLSMGWRKLTGKRIIGYWAWELPRIPDSWRPALDFVDEIWAPSRFTADAIRPFTAKPVAVVPHPVALQPPQGRRDRAAFGLPEDAFVVLTMFHMGTGFERKNPLAAIRAFRAALGARKDAMLVIKVADADVLASGLRRLEEAIAGAGNIRVIREKLSRQGVRDLIASADAVLSLHRAEGFGLVLAEAMLLGKPVVATGWSGNLDFMTSDTAVLIGAKLVPVDDPQGNYIQRELFWADPDADEAAAALARLYNDRAGAVRLGERAAASVRSLLGLEEYRRAVSARLPALPPVVEAANAARAMSA